MLLCRYEGGLLLVCGYEGGLLLVCGYEGGTSEKYFLGGFTMHFLKKPCHAVSCRQHLIPTWQHKFQPHTHRIATVRLHSHRPATIHPHTHIAAHASPSHAENSDSSPSYPQTRTIHPHTHRPEQSTLLWLLLRLLWLLLLLSAATIKHYSSGTVCKDRRKQQ